MKNEHFATIEAKISTATIPLALTNFNYRTDKIICPNCCNDTIPFSEYNGGEIYCEHCNEHLNALHFVAKNIFKRPLKTFTKQEDYQGLLSYTCAKLGIKHDFKKLPPTDETPNTEIKKLFGANASDFFKNNFPAFIAENQKYQNRKTGFSNLDDEIKSFQPGIYILGGLPALGKTTFALQLLNQLAKKGETCIFCSYEMSAGYLYSKLLAQEIFLIESGGFNEDIQHFNKEVKYPLPTSKIVFGNSKFHEEAYNQALKNFENNPLPLYIWQIAEIDLNKLLNRIKQICNTLDKPPVVCIDYLQLLTGSSDNQKAALDDTLRKLFNFRSETNTTFIIISSLNRMNYNTEINFESFCGSGGIEYSADVIWGLQLLLDKRTHEDAEKAKKEIPRKIQLKCLKNRFGANFDIGFFYYPDREIFQPMFEYGAYTEYISTSRADESENE